MLEPNLDKIISRVRRINLAILLFCLIPIYFWLQKEPLLDKIQNEYSYTLTALNKYSDYVAAVKKPVKQEIFTRNVLIYYVSRDGVTTYSDCFDIEAEYTLDKKRLLGEAPPAIGMDIPLITMKESIAKWIGKETKELKLSRVSINTKRNGYGDFNLLDCNDAIKNLQNDFSGIEIYKENTPIKSHQKIPINLSPEQNAFLDVFKSLEDFKIQNHGVYTPQEIFDNYAFGSYFTEFIKEIDLSNYRIFLYEHVASYDDRNPGYVRHHIKKFGAEEFSFYVFAVYDAVGSKKNSEITSLEKQLLFKSSFEFSQNLKENDFPVSEDLTLSDILKVAEYLDSNRVEDISSLGIKLNYYQLNKVQDITLIVLNFIMFFHLVILYSEIIKQKNNAIIAEFWLPFHNTFTSFIVPTTSLILVPLYVRSLPDNSMLNSIAFNLEFLSEDKSQSLIVWVLISILNVLSIIFVRRKVSQLNKRGRYHYP